MDVGTQVGGRGGRADVKAEGERVWVDGFYFFPCGMRSGHMLRGRGKRCWHEKSETVSWGGFEQAFSGK